MHSEGPERSPEGVGSRRAWIVMIGLVFTLVGVVAITPLAPLQPPAFPGMLGGFAVGLIGLWLGGILLGYGLGIRARGRST